jgi:Tfp pilus assembly protein PilF
MIPQRLQLLKDLLEKEPTDSFLNYALALEYAKENNLTKAIELIEQIVQKDEQYLASYYQLGQLYEQQNQAQKALEYYKKGVLIAQVQKNKKTLNELNEAIFLLEE